MKKLSLVLVTALFIGCATNHNVTPKVNAKQELKILKKYSISKDKIKKIDNNYVFDILEENGQFNLYLLDKNYQIIKKVNIKGVIEPKSLKVYNDKIYILGYDNTANKPIIIVFDKYLKEISRKHYGDKFDTANDFIVLDKPIVLANGYDNGVAYTKVISDKTHTFKTDKNVNLTIIKPFNDGFVLAGEIMNDTGNALIVYTDKNFKPIWIRDIDLGVEENVEHLKIKDNKIIATIISQNYTGMENSWDIEIDKDGKIITKSKNFEIEDIPTKFK